MAEKAHPHHSHDDIHESPFWDRVGMFISSACAVHCLIAPLAPFALPWLSASFHHPLFHVVIAALVLPVGIWAFWRGYQKHRNRKVFLLGVVGIFYVGFAAFVPHQWLHLFGHDIVAITASLVMIVAHAWNRQQALKTCCKGH